MVSLPLPQGWATCLHEGASQARFCTCCPKLRRRLRSVAKLRSNRRASAFGARLQAKVGNTADPLDLNEAPGARALRERESRDLAQVLEVARTGQPAALGRGDVPWPRGSRSLDARSALQPAHPPSITAFISFRTNLSPFTKGCCERDASM